MSSSISTSCPPPNTTMTRGRSLVTTMLLAATIIVVSTRAAEAQEQTPNPRMLLNLDLFAAPTDDQQRGSATGASDSMLEQLRALRAMGYLSPDGPLPEDDDSDEPSSASPQPLEKSPVTQQ